jgi:hypothetical protein
MAFQTLRGVVREHTNQRKFVVLAIDGFAVLSTVWLYSNHCLFLIIRSLLFKKARVTAVLPHSPAAHASSRVVCG